MKRLLTRMFVLLAGLTLFDGGAYAQVPPFAYNQGGGFSPYPSVLSPAIKILPSGYDTITVEDQTYYYCNGIFYQKITIDDKYTIVPPPIGAVVYHLPAGYQYMFIDGIVYYVSGGVYYRQVLDGYKVVFPPMNI